MVRIKSGGRFGFTAGFVLVAYRGQDVSFYTTVGEGVLLNVICYLSGIELVWNTYLLR